MNAFHVHLPVPQDGSILVFATLAPDVDAFLLAILKGLASDEHLGILRESLREIFEILQVFVVRVVAIKPGKVGQVLRLVFACE